ncbi:hypothetical protein [Metabacillus fastidiosus]|uniref:hypothetical protein n=1 Tax=Metabacillus fastidiosus TaxID=1458 RepID=UPI002E1AA3F3|nr:hypothetical protein [Metabacillus fastidiosus]
MKDNDEQISEGLNQLFEIINAKGDTGELNQIAVRYNTDSDKDDTGSIPRDQE